jgi:hypothetical protein
MGISFSPLSGVRGLTWSGSRQFSINIIISGRKASARRRGVPRKIIEDISKPILAGKCHSERSEESRLSNKLRSFTSFRMTEKTGIK